MSTAENTCDGSTVTATFTDDDGASRVGRGFPELRNGDTASSQALWWLDGSACNDEGIEVEIVFGGNAVENLAFSISDIDATGGWTDEIVVTAEFSGPLSSTISCGDGAAAPNCTSFTIDAANNTALGDANNGTFDNPAGRADFVIAGPVQRLTIRYQAADICDQSGGQVSAISGFTFDCSALPVTLSSFESRTVGRNVRFDWTTSTEIENIGFHLYGEFDGEWKKLNSELIPSRAFDSLTPQSYSAEFAAPSASRFALAEVDRRGREKLHGPYDANLQVGAPVEATVVDWGEVRREAVRRVGVEPSLRGAPSALLSAAPAAAQAGGGVSMVDLQVTENGIHRVTYDDLAAAGFDLDGVAGADLAIVNERRVVPMRVVSPGEFFSVGDYLEFYGEELETLYTSTNVYRLSARPRHAKRVREITPKIRSEVTTNYVADRRFEENNVYSFASPVGDPWFDRPMLAFGSPLTESFEFEVNDLVAEGDLPELTVELWGVTDWPTLNPDHHVVASVNGVVVEDFEFDGLSDATFTVQLPFDLLVDGTNTLELTLPADTGADFDLVHVEAYSVRYPRALQAEEDRISFTGQSRTFSVDGLTEPDVVVYARLGKNLRRIANVAVESSGSGFKATFGGSGRRELGYEVSTESALLQPVIVPSAPRGGLFGGEADYLIVSHAAFEDGLDPLVAAREADGFSVRVADVARVFSRYTGGVFDPDAIRQYVAEAVAEMGVQYVVLVGGDTYDYHDYLGVGSVSFVPTVYATTHAVVRYSPADSLLADIDGDNIQDVAIGRFPVRTLDELETMIDKTLQYSSVGTSVFAADAVDGTFSFSEISESMVETLSPEWSADRAYIDDLGFSGARDALIEAFDSGASLVSYIGHSSAMSWTFDSLFTNGDALALNNAGQPAVVLQWGCWSGYHSVPEYDTLSHSLLLGGANGAAVVVGASTLTEASADEALALEMYPALMVPGQSIGEALLIAKRALAAQGGDFDDVLFGTTILGDPAVVVQP